MENNFFVFLDRDGTINIDPGYISDPANMHLISGAAQAIGNFNRNNYKIIIVTNQSGIGRGYASVDDIDSVHAELKRKLIKEDSDATLTEILYCPHTPEDGCKCRKPNTQMAKPLFPISAESIANSFVVGDRLKDLEFGFRLGIPEENCILVRTGMGKDEELNISTEISFKPVVVNDLLEASRYVMGR